MQATWVPVATGGGGVTAPAGVVLAQPVATQQQNFLLLSLLCNQANPCVGAIRVQNQGAAGGGIVNARAKKPRTLTFAKSDFTIPAGQTQQVPIKLTKKGKRMLKKSQRPTLYANLVVDGTPSTAGTITVGP